MREDQHPAGARAPRRSRARRPSCRRRWRARTRTAGRRSGRLRPRGDGAVLLLRGLLPVERLVVARELLVALELDLARRQLLELLRGDRAVAVPASRALGLGESAISVPDRASTWCAESVGAVGQVRLLLGEQALEAEHERVLTAPLRPMARCARRRSRRGRRRAHAGAASRRPARTAGSSPSCRKGSSANCSARLRSASDGEERSRTEVLAAMLGLREMREKRDARRLRSGHAAERGHSPPCTAGPRERRR